MSFSKHAGDLYAGKSPSAASASPPNDSSDTERQPKKGPDASTSTSRRSLLQSPLPARKTGTTDGSQKAHWENVPPHTVADVFVLSEAAPQPAAAASSNLVVWKNPLPRPTKSPAYKLDPRYGDCHDWEGGAGPKRGWDGYSTNPDADFNVSSRRI